MKINTLKNNKGFTIIETLVAITILMISIAGPLTIAQKSLMAAIYAKDQVVASFLAQERMEEIKRDKNNEVTDGTFTTWASGFNGGSNSCHTIACDLYQNNSTSMYSTDSTNSTKSKYNIKYHIEGYNSSSSYAHEAKVVVEVSWKTGTIVNVVKLQNFMFNVTL